METSDDKIIFGVLAVDAVSLDPFIDVNANGEVKRLKGMMFLSKTSLQKFNTISKNRNLLLNFNETVKRCLHKFEYSILNQRKVKSLTASQVYVRYHFCTNILHLTYFWYDS